MSYIKVLEKPESISYDVIHQVLWRANETNRKKGFKLKTAELSGDELQERIGKQGKCFVAMDGENVVGTISVRLVKRNTWYAKGEFPDYILAGVIPEYQGKHINSILAQKVFEFTQQAGYALIELDTADNNKHAIEVYKHQGFRLVDYKAYKGLDHYSVIMVKWMSECPCSQIYCSVRYNMKRFLVRLRYKVGRVKRIGI